MAKGRQKTKGGGGGGGRKTRIGIGVEARSTGRSKGGGGGVEIVPTLTVERDRRRTGGRAPKRKGRTAAEHLLDLRVEAVTPAAKWVAPGSRLTVTGSGPNLVLLSPRGALGLASREASEAIRSALAAAPGGRLECRVTAVSEGRVAASVTLHRSIDLDEVAVPGGARPSTAPAAESPAPVAASSRAGR